MGMAEFRQSQIKHPNFSGVGKGSEGGSELGFPFAPTTLKMALQLLTTV